MVYFWMIIAGTAVCVVVGVGGFLAGRRVGAALQTHSLLRRYGITPALVDVYQDAMRFAANVVRASAVSDITAPIEEQTLLPEKMRDRARDLLARYEKELGK